MFNYLVSYDLTGPARDYEKLFSKLRSYAYAKPLESVWIVSSSLSASGLFNEIQPYIDSDDKLFIIKTMREAVWTDNIPDGAADWMQKYL